MSTIDQIYTSLVNKARNIRRRILRLISYELPQRILYKLAEQFEDAVAREQVRSLKAREYPSALRLFPSHRDHTGAPSLIYVLKNTLGDIYTDIGVASPEGRWIEVVTDVYTDMLTRQRLRAILTKKAPAVAIEYNGRMYVPRTIEMHGVSMTFLLSASGERIFVGSERPKLTDSNEYMFRESGVYFDYREFTGEDDSVLDPSKLIVVVDLCEFLAYLTESGAWNGGVGMIVHVINELDAEITVHVGMLTFRVGVGEELWWLRTDLWHAEFVYNVGSESS